jgi:uncharacterized membrane protein YgcG
MSADGLVDLMVNDAYGIDPKERLYAPGRLARTEARFITAAAEAYCPYDQSKLASIMANPVPGWNEPTHRAAAYTHNAVNSGGDLRGLPRQSDCEARGAVLASLIGAVPSGEVTEPDPPEIPPPPAAQIQIPHRPVAAPPPPKQPPPPPQQVEPPAAGPQPGGGAGSGGGSTGGNGGGGNGSGSPGGGGPAEPAPEPPMPPGFVRLAP